MSPLTCCIVIGVVGIVREPWRELIVITWTIAREGRLETSDPLPTHFYRFPDWITEFVAFAFAHFRFQVNLVKFILSPPGLAFFCLMLCCLLTF